MSNPYNGSKTGRRNPNRPSRDREPKPHSTITAAVAETAPYFECSRSEESAADYLIPRRSLTNKHHLKLYAPDVDLEPVPARRITYQIDKRTGATVEVTDDLTTNRVTWRGDQTLLRRNKPDAFGEGRGTTYARITSHSKRRIYITETKDASQDTTILPAILTIAQYTALADEFKPLYKRHDAHIYVYDDNDDDLNIAEI